MNDLPPYEQLAALSEVDFLKLVVETLDFETTFTRQTQEIYARNYGQSQWAPNAARRHHVLCAIADLFLKWIAVIEKSGRSDPFFTRSRDVLRDAMLSEIKQLNPSDGSKS